MDISTGVELIKELGIVTCVCMFALFMMKKHSSFNIDQNKMFTDNLLEQNKNLTNTLEKQLIQLEKIDIKLNEIRIKIDDMERELRYNRRGERNE